MMKKSRLAALIGATALALACTTACAPAAAPDKQTNGTSHRSSTLASEPRLADALKTLEQKYRARIGVSVIDTRTGETRSYRGNERFGFASTLKAFLAAIFLREFPESARSEHVTWTQADVDAAGYSPVTSAHIDDGLTLAELAEATVRTSDNTAFNIVAKRLGGVAGLQEKLRGLGDGSTEVRDLEPDLNKVVDGQVDNTTVPEASAALLAEVATGQALSESDRKLLLDWMSGNATGDTLIRAGVPASWAVADKSGGAGPMRNDIAVIDTGSGSPLVVSVLTRKNDPEEPYEDALVADVAKALFAK